MAVRRPRLPHPGVPGVSRGATRRISGWRAEWEVVYVRPPGHTLTQLRKWQKHALLALGKKWHQEYLPKHFESGGYREYGYQRRTYHTQRWKRKRLGHIKPLVKFGILEYGLRSYPRITATSKRVRVRMTGPWYLGARRRKTKGGLSPDLGAEVIAVSDKEFKELAAFARGDLQAQSQHDRKVVRKRLG